MKKYSQNEPMIEIETESTKIKLTLTHVLVTKSGIRPAQTLKLGEELFVNGVLETVNKLTETVGVPVTIRTTS